MITLDNADELLLRDVAIRVLVKLEEQLLSLGHVGWGSHHLIDSEYGSENIIKYSWTYYNIILLK